MGCYWEIDGEIVAKKGSVEDVVDILKNYGMSWIYNGKPKQKYDEEDEKISFSYYGYASSYSMPDDLDNDLRPLAEKGEFTAHTDEESSTSCYRYGKEPFYEETTVLEYFPSQIEEFVETLPQDVIDAVVRKYAGTEPAAKKEELRVQTPAGPIVAKVMPDEDYPGIIVMNEKEPGQPAAILEYSPTAFGDTRSCMELRVYDEANPDDEPIAIYQMSEDLRAKEDKNV